MSAQPHRTLSSSLSLPSTAFDLAAFSARTSSCSSSSPPLVASVLDLIVISAAHYSLAVASYASSCFGQLAATRGASARLHCLATLLPACHSSWPRCNHHPRDNLLQHQLGHVLQAARLRSPHQCFALSRSQQLVITCCARLALNLASCSWQLAISSLQLRLGYGLFAACHCSPTAAPPCHALSSSPPLVSSA